MGREPPSVVGALSELAVATGLRKAGYDVYTPFFNAHSRIDLIAVRDGVLQRLQVKTGRLCNGTLVFATSSHTGGVERCYVGEVDAFAVHAPVLDHVYLVPIDDVPMRAARLRLEPTRNNQSAGVRWAADYLVGPP